MPFQAHDDAILDFHDRRYGRIYYFRHMMMLSYAFLCGQNHAVREGHACSLGISRPKIRVYVLR
jgi:hypothetical protein